MTHILLGQNKFIATFTLGEQLKNKKNDKLAILQPSPLVLVIPHSVYACIYYQDLYNHFKVYIEEGKYTKDHIRIIFRGIQLSGDIPMGLYLPEQQDSYFQFQIAISEFIFMDSFKVMKNTWKKSFQCVNYNRKCDYVKTRLNDQQLKVKYRLYSEGKSTNFHNQGLYQGTHVFLRGFCQNDIIQRVFPATKDKNICDLFPEVFPEIFNEDRQIKQKYKGSKIYSHCLELRPQMKISTKQFVDLWNYNDGFCYIKLVLKQTN